MKTGFLKKNEYLRTAALMTQAFGDPEFTKDHMGETDAEGCCTGPVRNSRIAVLEDEAGNILSMVHIKPVRAEYADGSMAMVHYIHCVATDKDHRHRGYMDQVMKLVMDTLKKEGEAWCFLVAVDKEIYRHLNFVHDWSFRECERDLLLADDDLTDCSACLLNAPEFHAPTALS